MYHTSICRPLTGNLKKKLSGEKPIALNFVALGSKKFLPKTMLMKLMGQACVEVALCNQNTDPTLRILKKVSHLKISLRRDSFAETNFDI